MKNDVSANFYFNCFLLKLVVFFLLFTCILQAESKADNVSHLNDNIQCRVYEYIQVNQQGFKVGQSCVRLYNNDILIGDLPVVGSVLHITRNKNKLSIHTGIESVEIDIYGKSCKGTIRGEFKLWVDYLGIVKESPGFIRMTREYHILPIMGE